MKNDLSQTIFYLDLKDVHKYGSGKFQSVVLFTANGYPICYPLKVWQKKKKSRQTHRGSRRDRMPQLGPPMPSKQLSHHIQFCFESHNLV